MKQFITSIVCCLALVSCTAMNKTADFMANTGSLVNAKSVTLIATTAALSKKQDIASDLEKVSVALKLVTEDKVLNVDDLKALVANALADSSVKNKNIIMASLNVVFEYYANSVVISDVDNEKYVTILESIAAGLDEALKINSLTEGEVPAATK